VGLELAPADMLAPEDRERHGLGTSAGVVVTMVVKDSPAHTAGLRFGERVLRLAGKELPAPAVPETAENYIDRTVTFRAWVATIPQLGLRIQAGDEVEVVVEREGKATPVKVKALPSPDHLALLEAMARILFPDPPAPAEGSPPAPRPRGSAGMQVASSGLMQERERRYLNVHSTNELVVVHVMPGSPAQVAGVRAGDVLARYADKPAFDATGMDLKRWQEAFQAFLGVRHAGEEIDVELLRGSKTVKARVRLVDQVTLKRTEFVTGVGNRF
jgi:S1-C subfamily serine protease